MAQLRQDYKGFVERNTEVIAVGPDSRRAFKDYWQANEMPFIGLADPNHVVAKQYSQEVNLLKFGRIPAQLLIDKSGTIRYLHYSNSMSDIPDNQEIFELLDEINNE
jgi:peroxiredoxin Q/BCP